MINLFPTMFLSLVAHAILRIFIGTILVSLGIRHYRRNRTAVTHIIRERFPLLSGLAPYIALKWALFEVIIGLMFIGGIYTQVAAILCALLSIKMLLLRNMLPYPLIPQPMFWFLTLGVSLSLFITGAGVFAFDIPI